MHNKLYLLFVMFGGECIGEIDVNKSSKIIIDTAGIDGLNDRHNWYRRLNQCSFKTVFDKVRT